MPFGRNGERVAKPPLFSRPPSLGGVTSGVNFSTLFSEKPHIIHKCENSSIPRSASGFWYFGSNTICSNTSRQNARPQRGLSSADLLIECKVEGGITRFCAVFHDADSIPEIGPLRSGRDQFLQLLMPYQALYYHDGESAACTKFINVYNYSGLNIGGKSYFNTPTHPHVAHRDSRGRDVAYEHTEFTSGKEIRQAASNAGIGLKYDYDLCYR